MDARISRRQFELAALAAAAGTSRATAQQTAPAKEVPWLREIQTPPVPMPPDAPRLSTLLINARGDRITTRALWEQRRQEIRAEWLQFLGVWDPPRYPPKFEIITSDRTPRVTRRLIRYDSERNVPVEAYLLLPTGAKEPRPGVVVLHSTVDYTIRQGAGLEGDPAAAWGLRLAERGFAALCPRCFLWDGTLPANYQGQVIQHQERHPGALGMAKMLYDGQRALDVLASMEEVDKQRLGVAGHSLGAKEALYLAAFDERVKATVSSEGGIGTAFSNWDAPWYLGTRPAGHDHHEVLSLVAPRPFLLIGGESADGARSWPYIAAALEVYGLYPQPSRVGLYNHRRGHTIPPIAEQRVYEWLGTYV